jgi:sialate O-acetylesterase
MNLPRRVLTWLAFGWTAQLMAQSPETNSLRLPAIFGDNMVLQQQMRVPVWGWANPGERVTVHCAGQEKTATADPNGHWLVTLGRMKATSEPQTLEVKASQTLRRTNILIGEVWLASGQSNMEKPVGKQPGQKPCFNAEAEIAAAEFPQIRLFKIEKAMSPAPLTNLGINSGWLPCHSNTLDGIHFSAAAYFFGREIFTNLNVPVGLIESAWGGTRIEPWTPPVGFTQVPSLATLAEPVTVNGKLRNTQPQVLFNSMIAPITGFAMRGALWYQGESNLMGTNNDDYLTYPDKMNALVGGWRKLWNEGDFAFYFVQIAPYKYNAGTTRRTVSPEKLPEFWTLQSKAARSLRNVGMVVTTDITDDVNDIHPRDKASVGHRLALLARHQTYGQSGVVCASPVLRKAKFQKDQVTLRFDHADGGLVSRDGQPLTWFTVAGADGHFVPAQATIKDSDTVVVSAAGLAEPKAVRFAWAETAIPNLSSRAGFPAEPFQAAAK